MDGCVFCPNNWDNLAITERYGESIAILMPLNPVVPGHRLVISEFHTADAAGNPATASGLMHSAAAYVSRNKLQANIITSIGPAATQTVMHTHLHIVPRTEGDGLMLPWTYKDKIAREDEMLRRYAENPAGVLANALMSEMTKEKP